MTFERILSHFQVRKRGTGKAQCICPAHADREASLTLTDGNDRVLIIGGIIEKELDAREKAQQKRIKKYTDKYAKKEVAEA